MTHEEKTIRKSINTPYIFKRDAFWKTVHSSIYVPKAPYLLSVASYLPALGIHYMTQG
jgi:hypothetical protein